MDRSQYIHPNFWSITEPYSSNPCPPITWISCHPSEATKLRVDLEWMESPLRVGYALGDQFLQLPDTVFQSHQPEWGTCHFHSKTVYGKVSWLITIKLKTHFFSLTPQPPCHVRLLRECVRHQWRLPLTLGTGTLMGPMSTRTSTRWGRPSGRRWQKERCEERIFSTVERWGLPSTPLTPYINGGLMSLFLCQRIQDLPRGVNSQLPNSLLLPRI